MFHVKLSKSISCDLIRETFKNKCRETFLKPLFSGMLLIIGSRVFYEVKKNRFIKW